MTTEATTQTNAAESARPSWRDDGPDLFTFILDERISAMEIDITLDELKQLVRASQIIGQSPVDFLREATLSRANDVIEADQRRSESSDAAD